MTRLDGGSNLMATMIHVSNLLFQALNVLLRLLTDNIGCLDLLMPANTGLECLSFAPSFSIFRAHIKRIFSRQSTRHKSRSIEAKPTNCLGIISRRSRRNYGRLKSWPSFLLKLNTEVDSPLYRRILVAAENDFAISRAEAKAENRWMISTATIVDGITRLISTSPKKMPMRCAQGETRTV